VAQILQSARVGHSACQLQFDERFELEVTDTVDLYANRRGIRECHGLWLPIPREPTGDDAVYADTRFPIPENPLKRGYRARPGNISAFIQSLQRILTNDHVDIIRGPVVSVRHERHAAADGIGHAERS